MSAEKEGIVNELHKPARRNYPRRKVRTEGIDHLWQADLVEMIPYSSVNGGMKYLLTVIDTFSKYAFAEPVKSKSGRDITEAMRKVLRRSGRCPRSLQVDQGSEFYNSLFQTLMRERDINLYSSYSTKKASIVERFNRTLKTRMWKKFSLRGSYKWTDLLGPLLTEYNEKNVHRTTGMKPADVTEADTATILRRLRGDAPARPAKPKFRRGDYVRLSKQKSLFEKGYTPNWSMEVFRVVRVQGTRPTTYILKDLNGTEIKGGFYAEELQKTRFKDVYLVEKVLRKQNGRAYVKWLGFPESANSWIKTSDIL